MADLELLADLYAAFDSAHCTMALSSQDWSTSRDVAWLWGILVGWADGEGGALPELAARFGWTADDVARLKRFRSAIGRLETELFGVAR